MIQGMLITAMVLFAIAIAMAVYSLMRGPSLPDRVIAMDFIGINLISAIAVVSVLLHTKSFLEVILILGILAFISTIALSKFIERGVIIERNRNQ